MTVLIRKIFLIDLISLWRILNEIIDFLFSDKDEIIIKYRFLNSRVDNQLRKSYLQWMNKESDEKVKREYT